MKTGSVICAAALVLAACQTPDPVTEYSALAPAQAVLPVSVPVAATAESGPRINQWGGEVPEAAPAADVSEGGLGAVR